VMFGDGFDVMPDPLDNRFGYAMSQGGNVARYDRLTGNSRFIKPVHPDGLPLRFNWNGPIAQDPFNQKGLYYGSQFVHHSTDQGNSWKILSPDLTTNDPEKQKQAESGGLTIDATQAENFTTILAIEPSTHDKEIIWVGTDDGNLQLTTDGGQNWTELSDRLPGYPSGSWIPQIVCSQKNSSEVLVVVNNYRRDDWRPFLYRTKDLGKKWERIVDVSDVSGYVMTVAQDPEEPRHMWLGTDHGLYFTIDAGSNWNKWTQDFPSVNTADLKIHPRELDLIIGTFGRAVHILDDLRPFREMAQAKGSVLKDSFSIFPAPDAYLASYRSVDGSRFGADAQFQGKNRMRGAMITAFVKPNKKGKSEKKKDKIKVKVVNSQGDTIRTFSTSVKDNMFRFSWNLREDGVRYPSRETPKKDADLPSGLQVLPGNYQIICTYKNWSENTWVKVLADPRMEWDEKAELIKRSGQQSFQKQIGELTASFDQLMQAKKNINQINKHLSHLPDSTQKPVKKMGKEQIVIIDSLANEYMLPKEFKGIDGVTPKITRTLWRTLTYLRSSDGAPGENAQNMLNQAKLEIGEAIQSLNQYIENEWTPYLEKVKDVGPQPWKDLEKVD
ncbi:MAG: hypothetical protein HKN16_10255, partial [Saprospiraceae bacterium]|nr:hypothetical protein [Saprospiraceae bacterium]